MDIERDVDDFVARAKTLFRHLEQEGEALSDLGLHILRAQLHTLSIETSRLQRKRFTAKRTITDKSSTDPPQSAKSKKSPLTCEHRRLFDDYVADGQPTGFVYCLECMTVFKDPFSKCD